MQEIKRCKRCIMDNSSDMTINFDEKGYCNYCTTALSQVGKIYFPGEEGQKRLNKLLATIKAENKGKKYDCIMGLSGGLDSSYLAYLGYKWGLRVLCVHIDDGYDTEISKKNLKKLIQATGFDYEIIRPDAEQFNDLNLAFMKAGLPNIGIPQDNILLAFLYKKMRQYGIKNFFSGGNFSLECILQQGHSYPAIDAVHIRDINKRFGTKKINKLELLSFLRYHFDRLLLGIKTERPLNYIDYNRNRAFQELADFCRFEYYGSKHLENIFTAFLQLYWLPRKFNVDKRTSHLSSMVVSGQMTRDEALNEYSKPLSDEVKVTEYVTLIKETMRISDAEFEKLMRSPIHEHEEYAIQTDTVLYKICKKLHKLL